MTYDGSIRIDTRIDTSAMNNGINNINNMFSKGLSPAYNSLKKLAGVVATTFSLTAIARFAQDSVNETAKMQAAWVGLQSIVEGQGRSFDKAQSFIENYIKDGLVPATNAITAYKNLAARGYNDDQITKTMLNLKNASSFGRQASLSMGEAVQSASEGLKNENSILVDNAGVTKNVSKMWEEYAKSIGTTSDKLTQQQKIQAEVNGIAQETRFQQEDAAKYAETYSGQVSALSANFLKLKQNIGALIQPIFVSVISVAGAAVNQLNIFAQAIGKVISMFTGKNPLNSLTNTSDNIDKVSNGVSSIGDSATSSKGKVDKLKKALLGIDEMNILTDPNKDKTSGGGSSSSGVDNSINSSLDNIKLPNFSDKVDSLAQKIKSFLDGTIKTLDTYSPILKGIGTAFLTAFGFKWVVSAITKFSKISAIAGIILALKQALVVTTLVFNLTLNPLTALAAGFGILWSSLMKFLGGLSPIAKLGTSIVALVAIFNTTQEAVKKFTLGTNDLGQTLMNIIPIAGLVGVAMYGMLGPWGLVAAAIVGIIAAVSGYNDAIKEMATSAIFGDLELSSEQLNKISESIGQNISEQADEINTFKNNMNSLNDEFDNSVRSVEAYNIEFGMLNKKITSEDVPQIINSIEQLGQKTTDIIEESTTNSLVMWSNMFKDTTSISKDEQKNILLTISQTGEAQKKEVSTIQKNITDTYNTGIKARGYLTDEEYNYVSTQLARLREITNVEMMKTQADVEINKRIINDSSLELSKKGYEDLLSSIETGEKEASETAKTLQNQAYVDAEIARKNAIDQKTLTEEKAQELYMSMLKVADEEYRKEMSAVESNTMSMLKGTRDKITGQKSELIKSMQDGGTDLQKEQLRQLDELERGLNQRIGSYSSTMLKMGQEGANAFNNSFTLSGPYSKMQTFADKLRENTNTVLRNLSASYNSLRVNGDGKISYSSMPAISTVIPRMAKGGIVNRPTQIIAGEAGREAIVPLENNTEWLDMLAEKMGSNGNSGNTYVFKIGEETIFKKFIAFVKSSGFENNESVVLI